MKIYFATFPYVLISYEKEDISIEGNGDDCMVIADSSFEAAMLFAKSLERVRRTDSHFYMREAKPDDVTNVYDVYRAHCNIPEDKHDIEEWKDDYEYVVTLEWDFGEWNGEWRIERHQLTSLEVKRNRSSQCDA